MARRPRIPPNNDNANTLAQPSMITPGPPAPASVTTPKPFFPRASLFPFSRAPSASRLPPRQPVQPLASIGTQEPELQNAQLREAGNVAPPAAGGPGANPGPFAAGPPFAGQPPAAPHYVVPPGPQRLPVPPVRVVGPSQADAAANNEYSQRIADRESHRWGRRTEVVQPETLLVHAWAWALTMYPATALTVWLKRTAPGDNPYELYITGDMLVGDPFPDRKLFETIRSKRRQPQIAESFAGRIRGMTSEGQVLDIGGGEIHLPPEPPQAAASAWGAPAASPWGGPAPGYGMPSPWSPYGAQPPPQGGGWGPYGPPPPWWAQMQAPPWMLGGAPQPAPPPAAIAHDPMLVDLWKGMQAAQQATLQASNEAQAKVAATQSQLMQTLLERALEKSGGGGQGGGGSVKETFGLLRDALGLVKDLQGGGGDDKALQIVETRGGDKIFSTGGKVHEGLTYGIAIKDGVTELLKGMGRLRAPAPGQAPAVGAPGVGGSTLPPKTGAATGAKPTTNGAR